MKSTNSTQTVFIPPWMSCRRKTSLNTMMSSQIQMTKKKIHRTPSMKSPKSQVVSASSGIEEPPSQVGGRAVPWSRMPAAALVRLTRKG